MLITYVTVTKSHLTPVFSFGKMGTTAPPQDCEWVLWNIYPFIPGTRASMHLTETAAQQTLKYLLSKYLNLYYSA